MDHHQHTAIGLVAGIIFIAFAHYLAGWFCVPIAFSAISTCLKSLGIYLLIILFYSLAPDCDHPISTITWNLIGLSIVGLLLGWYLKSNLIIYFFFCVIIFTYFCSQFMPHRGPIHSITFGIIFSAPLYFLFGLPEACLAFACFYSHLAADGEWIKFW